jgi:putative transposase
MPRQGRVDFPGALHHVIIRGINRAAIFFDDRDRKDFLRRLETGILEVGLSCYAWALLPNHIHLLLRTNNEPLANLMRSLLTGYAVSFNRRHKRVGYLFQNRYKSILCEESSYLLQLVRYIHLNPLRAGLAPDIAQLNFYPWCGHSCLIGNYLYEWQDASTILSIFDRNHTTARQRYLEFIKKGIAEGKRSDLTGGGLIRSVGGWEALKSVMRESSRWRGDERILGSSDFVNSSLEKVKDHLSKKITMRQEGWDLDVLLDYVAGLTGVDRSLISGKKRDSQTSNARALFIWWATSELGYTLAETAEYLSINKSSATRAAEKGKRYSSEQNLRMLCE